MGQLGDTLKTILQQFAMQAPQDVGNALYARMAPEAFQQQQENLRQQMQLAQQMQMHGMMTPYEQAQISQAQQSHQDALAQQQFENQSSWGGDWA